jgi:hypothetical protein
VRGCTRPNSGSVYSAKNTLPSVPSVRSHVLVRLVGAEDPLGARVVQERLDDGVDVLLAVLAADRRAVI